MMYLFYIMFIMCCIFDGADSQDIHRAHTLENQVKRSQSEREINSREMNERKKCAQKKEQDVEEEKGMKMIV